MVRTLAIGVGIALAVFALTGGHVFFLPLLFIPLGLFFVRPSAEPPPPRLVVTQGSRVVVLVGAW
jgi:hypothetical protein